MTTQYRIVEIHTPHISEQKFYPLYQIETSDDGFTWQYKGDTLSDQDSAFNRVRCYQKEQRQSNWETVQVRKIQKEEAYDS